MTATPFSAIIELVADTGLNGKNSDGSAKSLRPGELVARPITFADVAGGLSTFADDSALEYIAEDDMWLTDVKVKPGASDAVPAAVVNSVQLMLNASAKRWEYFISQLTVTGSNISRPKMFFIPKGSKLQLKTNVR